ncbi:MAG: hypothetical protein H6702_04380 [Myxococcales bacterium]|nr:hypothetical protein [Myxococcales bacterium]
MRDVLAMLVELQGYDDALHDTRALQQRIEKLTVENAEGLALFDKMLEERAARIDDVGAFVDEKSDELVKLEETTRRSRGKMGAVTNQRELAALNKEMDIQRRMSQSLTAELAKLREELAEAEKDQAEKQAERDALAQRMAEVEGELKAQLTEKLAAASEIQGKREDLRKRMPPRERGRYDRIAKARQGKAVADVEDGCCVACKMRVPPGVHQKVLRLNSLEMCQSCQRLLVWYEGLAGSAEN